MLNSDRFIYRALKNIANRKGYIFHTYSYGWIVEIIGGTRVFRLTWYTFDINSPSGVLIATDKYATYTLLNGIIRTEYMIPSVFVFCKWKEKIIGREKAEIIEEFVTKFRYPFIIKDSHGSRWIDVFKVRNREELIEKIDYFESIGCDAILSPFVNSMKELRIILLDGEIHIAYYKYAREGWKFNLSQWAITEVIQHSEYDHIAQSIAVAKKVMFRLWLRFASCDFLITWDGNFTFLEINSGVCVDRFVEQNSKYSKKLERMYEIALEKSFL